jgi:GMP synthase-like glutamine amidotransferase
LLQDFAKAEDISVHTDEFDVRAKNEIADISYDIYISTGGPGSPITSEGSDWETRYFGMIEDIRRHNMLYPDNKKSVFLICHSFQIFCRYYGLGNVSRRKSPSFGVMPVHQVVAGTHEPFFEGLDNPFWAVDSREYQVTSPDLKKIRAMGGDVLCIEKYRPHVRLERCVMAIRFDDAFFGVQFHPEADSTGMLHHMKTEEKKSQVIANFGEEKYNMMLDQLDDPEKIRLTHDTIIPLFLKSAISADKDLILK